MKSYFSRFLHHTLSHSGIREVFTSSLSLSDLIGESRSNKVANLSHLDYRVKPDNDSLCAGRSMVEMLGVLAIIGVLSVGAIAGYSKAMNKYKINKTIEAANQLLATVFTKFATDKSLLYADDNGNAYLTQIIVKSGWVPDGLKPYENVPSQLQDSFGNGIWVFTDVYHKTIGIGWGFKKSQKELCYNLLSLAKGWNDSLSQVVIDQTSTDDTPRKEYGTFYGNSSCQTGRKCLTDITVTEMDAVCNNCELSACRFYFYSNPF